MEEAETRFFTPTIQHEAPLPLRREERAAVRKAVSDLDDINRVVRCDACRALADSGMRILGVSAALNRALGDYEAEVRLEAAAALYALDLHDLATCAVVLSFLEDPSADRAVRLRSLRILVTSSLTGHTVNAMCTFLRDCDDEAMALEAAVLLADRMRETSRDARLVAVLENFVNGSQDPDVIYAAARALHAMGARPRRVVSAMMALLEGSLWSTRVDCLVLLTGATQRLGEARTTDAVVALLTTKLWDDWSPGVRKAAAVSLAAMGRLPAVMDDMEGRFEAGTPDERAEVVAAIEAIDLRGERALAVVHDALRDPSPSVRAAACAAAAAHWVRHPDGPLAVDERTVRLLKRCCRSEDWRTRTRAAEAMAAIGLVA